MFDSPLAPSGHVTGRVVFHGVGDGCSHREDERMRAVYLEAIAGVARGGQFCDPQFPPTDEALGGGLRCTLPSQGTVVSKCP